MKIKSTFLFIFLFSTLPIFAGTKPSSRVEKVRQQLSQSLRPEQFDVKNSELQKKIIEVHLDPNLGDSYKNQMHLWLLKTSNLDNDFKNIHLQWKDEPWLSNQGNILILAAAIIFLTSFLFFSLRFLSARRRPLRINRRMQNNEAYAQDNDEDYVTQQVEKAISKQLSK